EPPGLAAGLATAVAESTGLRLELNRTSWIRLGRDVVGQRTEALVARTRYGPPGPRAELRILYADGGERDDCLRRPDLLVDEAAPPAAIATLAAPTGFLDRRTSHDATPPALSAPLAPPCASLAAGLWCRPPPPPLCPSSPVPVGPPPPLRLVPDRPAG